MATGAEGGTRTPTPLRAHDPESCASANSATSARAGLHLRIPAEHEVKGPRPPGLSVMADETDEKVISTNRKARHDYSRSSRRYEAGWSCGGPRSSRSARPGQLQGLATRRSTTARRGCVGCHITPYHHGTDANHDPERPRKLLLHRREIYAPARQGGRARVDPRPASSILQGRAGEARAGAGPRQEAPRQARVHPRARRPAGAGQGGRSTAAVLIGRAVTRGRLVSTGISEAQVASRGALSS